MSHPTLIALFITLLLLPQVFVHGGLLRELHRKFVGLFKFSKHTKPGPFYDNCNLCSFGPCTPMLWPSTDNTFDATAEAKKLMAILPPGKNANLSDDEKAAIANILTERSAPQRAAIAEAFQKEGNKRIIDSLTARLNEGYRFYMLIKALSLPLPQFFHFQFEFAIKFIRKQEQFYQYLGQTIIVELLTTLPKCLINKAIESYNSIVGQDFISDLEKALAKVGRSNEYREITRKLIEQKRDNNHHASWIKALFYSYKLKSAVTSGREPEMKERFSELFIKFPITQIIETIVVYENLRFGDKEFVSLFDDIDKYYKGDEKEIYKIMTRLFKNKPLYYSKTIENILKSGKTGNVFEERLIYLIAGRYDIDLRDIVVAYEQHSVKGLRDDFEAWDISEWSVAFHPAMVNIIIKALRMPEAKLFK